MKKLIAKLEAATEGSRELGDEVLLAVGWEKFCYGHYMGPLYRWIAPPEQNKTQFEEIDRPNPTISIDATIALVPENRLLELKQAPHRKGWRVNLWEKAGQDSTGFGKSADATTPALAICIAALKARSA